MANARLLRQLARDYDERVNEVNSQYRDDRSIYEKAVAAHNASIDDAIGGTPYLGEIKGSPGTYGLFRGDAGGGAPAYVTSATVADALPEFSTVGGGASAQPVYVRNSDGTATGYEAKVIIGGSSGDNPQEAVYAWAPSGTYKFLPNSSPEAPDIGDPGDPGFTEKEKGLLSQPTLGPAEMSMANAKGTGGTSTLAGDQQPSAANSAFTNPEDPNNLKERGVLARVLGGQL